MQMIVLMQEDGHCWATCCPKRFDGLGQCGWRPTDPDATTIKGCDSSCNQHSSQENVFKRVKASAARQGLHPPHSIMYMNAVYLWPFDAASALGSAACVTDSTGAPHEESCDPGIYPSRFFDFSKSAGAKAWLDIIRTHVVKGAADGVYVDCDQTIPFHCPRNASSEAADICTAKRNGHLKSINENVTRAAVEAYRNGHNTTLLEAFRLVQSAHGTFYNKGAPSNKTMAECANWNPLTGKGRMEGACTGNIIWSGPKSLPSKGDATLPPPHLSEYIKSNMRSGKPYVIVGGANSFSDPRSETLAQNQDIGDGRSLRKTCTEDRVAQFLLAVEPGAYLLCNAWDERFGRPLGKPTGDAMLTGTTWTRAFESGVIATWDSKTKTGKVVWPSAPAQAMVI